MIYLERTITIANSSASIDEPIILYKGDRNVEIQFVLKNSPFRYKSSTNPTYGQLIINRENADSIFSDVSETVKGKILFVITGDMIDELNECGNYDFQIRLFNEDKTSRVTLMPIIAGIIIREPICEDDEANKETPYLEAYFDLKTKNNTDYFSLFYEYAGETLDVSNLDTSKVTSMSQMFCYCQSLTSLDVSNFDTSNVTKMTNMFYECRNLTSLDVSNFDTSSVTDMKAMFNGCNKLTTLDVSNWDVSKVTSMSQMFRECRNLTSLDVSNFDTSNVTTMNEMFRECRNLTSLDVSNFNTSNVTDMNYMFTYCNNLTTLDANNWDTSNVINMAYMFYACESLTSLDLSNWDVSKVTNFSYTFNNCTALMNLQAPKNISANISFSDCTKLTHDSLMSIINNLATVTSTKTLTLGSTNLAKLTDDEKTIATNKGWTLE